MIPLDPHPEALGLGGLALYQPAQGFRLGQDALLLAHFAAHHLPRRLLGKPWVDVMAGSGVVGLCFAARLAEAYHVPPPPGHALDLDPSMLACLAQNARAHPAYPLSIWAGDVEAGPAHWQAAGGRPSPLPDQASILLCNPPYQISGQGPSPQLERALAVCESPAGLKAYLAPLARWLHPNGRFYLCHRPHRLADLLVAGVAQGLALRRLCFVSDRPDQPPSLLLAEWTRQKATRLQMDAPLFLSLPTPETAWWHSRPGKPQPSI